MIIVNAKVIADETTIAAMKEAIAKMEAASRAEPGCDDYTFSVELGDAAVLRITERWHSADDLKKHFQTPHMAEFQGAMGAHPPKEMKVFCYEANEIPMPTP